MAKLLPAIVHCKLGTTTVAAHGLHLTIFVARQTLEWERHGRASDAVRPEVSPAPLHTATLAQPHLASPAAADIELPPHLAGCKCCALSFLAFGHREFGGAGKFVSCVLKAQHWNQA
jgi:hypothetical protein